jgi:hypothetical protein
MPFDKEAEANEPEPNIELIFDSGKPTDPEGLEAGPSAYIAMGWFSSDKNGRPMITNQEMSFGPLKSQVEDIKACLDACLADAKARFMAAGINV